MTKKTENEKELKMVKKSTTKNTASKKVAKKIVKEALPKDFINKPTKSSQNTFKTSQKAPESIKIV